MPISIKDYMNKRVSQEFFWDKKQDETDDSRKEINLKEPLSFNESKNNILKAVKDTKIKIGENKFFEDLNNVFKYDLKESPPSDLVSFFKTFSGLDISDITARARGDVVLSSEILTSESAYSTWIDDKIDNDDEIQWHIAIAKDSGGNKLYYNLKSNNGVRKGQLFWLYDDVDNIKTAFDSISDFVIYIARLLPEDSVSKENHYSEEACAGCAANASANVSAGNLVTVDGNTKAEAITNSGSFPPKGEQPSDGFTYDEGKGRKDIVQLTGPLSEVYTRALNIYYAKKPAFDADSVPEGMSQTETEELLNASMIPKLQQASESVQLQDSQMQAVLTDVLSTKLDDKAKDKFDFVNDSILSDLKETDPKVTAYFMPFKSAMHPEVIDLVTTKASDRNKEIVMVITDETKALSKGQGVRRHWIDLNENSTVNPTFTSNDKSMALESVYINNGVKVVNGFSGFVQYLNALAQ